jgi:hypothetical protein
MSSEAEMSLIEQTTDLSIRARNSGTDRRLDEHGRPLTPGSTCSTSTPGDRPSCGANALKRTITTRSTPDAGEILEADPADRLDAGHLATSHPRAWTRARAGLRQRTAV